MTIKYPEYFICICMTISLFSCGHRVPITNTPLSENIDSVKVYYDSCESTPWMVFRLTDVSVNSMLKENSLSCVTIRDKDSLTLLSGIINLSEAEILHKEPVYESINIWLCVAWHFNSRNLAPVTFEQEYAGYADTWYAALIYKKGKTDTLSVGCTPDARLQYNDRIFKDSTVFYYVFNAIRNHDEAWRNECDEYYRNGEFLWLTTDEEKALYDKDDSNPFR